MACSELLELTQKTPSGFAAGVSLLNLLSTDWPVYDRPVRGLDYQQLPEYLNETHDSPSLPKLIRNTNNAAKFEGKTIK